MDGIMEWNERRGGGEVARREIEKRIEFISYVAPSPLPGTARYGTGRALSDGCELIGYDVRRNSTGTG